MQGLFLFLFWFSRIQLFPGSILFIDTLEQDAAQTERQFPFSLFRFSFPFPFRVSDCNSIISPVCPLFFVVWHFNVREGKDTRESLETHTGHFNRDLQDIILYCFLYYVSFSLAALVCFIPFHDSVAVLPVAFLPVCLSSRRRVQWAGTVQQKKTKDKRQT